MTSVVTECAVKLPFPVCSPLSGEHRLSLLLSQASGSQHSRELLSMQLVDWNRLQTDTFIQEERLRIYALLAGIPVSTEMGEALLHCLVIFLFPRLQL